MAAHIGTVNGAKRSRPESENLSSMAHRRS
jgi:hypothetical protein